jgi:hypothetical protein
MNRCKLPIVLAVWAALASAGIAASHESAALPQEVAAPSAVEYEIVPPGHDWIVSWSAPDDARLYTLMIANKSEPLMGLRPVQLALRRTDGDSSIDLVRLRMLAAPDGPPIQAIDLKPSETKTIFLRLDPGSSRGPFGTFTGSVQFAADRTPLKVVALTAKASSRGVKVAGAFLVLIGLCLSVLLTNFLQPRLLRLQALRPAALLREALTRFADEARVAAADDVAGIEGQARTQAARLDPRALDADGLLPPRLSFGNAAGADAAARLKQRLEEISDRLAGLIVLRDAAVLLRSRAGTGPRPAPVTAAFALLNQSAPEVTNLESARAIVARALEQLRTAGLAENVRELPATAVSVDQIDFSLQQAASLMWAVWALVSFSVGITYVFSDADFGTASDLLGVFFWGFGLTTVCAGLQQLTPSTIATQVGLKLPRTGGAPQ